jgi:hypothetical protein
MVLLLVTFAISAPASAMHPEAPAPSAEPSSVPSPGPSNASVPLDCLANHVSAQELRLDGSLVAARELLRSCSAPTCPALVRADCSALLADVERAMPTVVLELVNPELDPNKVRVSLEGLPGGLLFGAVYELDAGAVALHAEAPGYEPLSETLVVREGEKNRVVQIRLLLPLPPALPIVVPPLGLPRQSLPAVDERARRAPVPRVVPYVFAAVALVGTATSAYFAWSALDRRARLERTCAPLCSERARQQVTDDLFASDLSGGIAMVAGGVSITLFVLDPGGDARR